MAEIVYRSPLAAKTGGGSLAMQEITGQTLLNLRGKADDAEFIQAATAVLGVQLPLSANTTTAAGDTSVFWLGPDEWLVRTAAASHTIAGSLQKALADVHAAVVDVSDYFTVIRIAGAAAREALAAACPLDLHPQKFLPGSCAQSHYGQAAVLLHLVDEAPTFDIQTRWSYADYVWEYLRAAGGA